MINELLRHTVASIGYRFQKATDHQPEYFGKFKASIHTRTPGEIILHMYDLSRKTLHFLAIGKTGGEFIPVEPVNFMEEKKRFLQSLYLVEESLGKHACSMEFSKQLLQGPLLDMATHVGQLAMLAGINGIKVPAENYAAAMIHPSRPNT